MGGWIAVIGCFVRNPKNPLQRRIPNHRFPAHDAAVEGRSLVSYRQAVARQANGAAVFPAGDPDWESVIRAGKTDMVACP